eukprot:1154387-Pelagomonas_calceolata.AAC.1
MQIAKQATTLITKAWYLFRWRADKAQAHAAHCGTWNGMRVAGRLLNPLSQIRMLREHVPA